VLGIWSRARSSSARTPDDEDVVGRLIAHDHSSLLVAQVDGRVVGALAIAWDGWRGHMYRLAVLPEHRRQGIATCLVDAGHEQLAARGARRVTAIVGRDEQPAGALWRAAGYEADDSVQYFARNL
jgi:ribosomal protein S18 acetylase RimI-like enzyme